MYNKLDVEQLKCMDVWSYVSLNRMCFRLDVPYLCILSSQGSFIVCRVLLG